MVSRKLRITKIHTETYTGVVTQSRKVMELHSNQKGNNSTPSLAIAHTLGVPKILCPTITPMNLNPQTESTCGPNSVHCFSKILFMSLLSVCFYGVCFRINYYD